MPNLSIEMTGDRFDMGIGTMPKDQDHRSMVGRALLDRVRGAADARGRPAGGLRHVRPPSEQVRLAWGLLLSLGR